MKKTLIYNFLLFVSIFSLSLFLTACSETKELKKSKMRVSLSTFVLYDIAQNISQDTLELVKIIPAGVGIHTYEPTPQVMTKIETSDLVIYNGVGLEPWLSTFTFKQRAVAIGNYVRLKNLEKETANDHASHDHSDGSACVHTGFDPHIWFDIKSMKKATDIITYEFISLQPQYKDFYLDNRDRYFEKLENLDALYKSKLQSCKLDTIITNHNAFSYLSSEYGFNIKTLSGLSPDKEVSPRDVIRLLNDVKKHNVSVVFFENFGSDKEMKSIALQANVELDALHPLGNITKDDAQANSTYEDLMKQNLDKISKALVCQ